jgi:hypothetical protein
VGNDPEWEIKSPMAGLLKLQTEFYTRLTEETLKYLRHIQGASLPAIPGTVLLPREGLQLEASGAPGETVEIELEIENRQRVHCVVTPMLSPFIHTAGATWFPSAVHQASLLLAPEQIDTLKIQLPLPSGIPYGVFRGALLLQGFRENGILVAITVTPARPAAPAKPAAAAKAAPARKQRAPKQARQRKQARRKGVKKP